MKAVDAEIILGGVCKVDLGTFRELQLIDL